MPEFRIDQIGGGGLNTDQAPGNLPPPVCTQMTHVLTEDGQLRSGMYQAPIIVPAIEPLYHTAHPDPTGNQWLIYSDGRKVYAHRPSDTPVDISAASPWGSGRVTFAALNTVLFVNHENQGLFYWSGPGSTLQPAPGWPVDWRCRSIAAFRYNLVALGLREGVDEFDLKLRWSVSVPDGSIPTDWAPAATNDAGDDVLGETPGKIVGSTLVGDRLFVVKEDGLYEMTWIGQPFVFQVRRVSDTGTDIERGFTAMRDRLVILTSRDVAVWDGTDMVSLVDTRVRRALREYVTSANWRQAALFYHDATKRLYVGLANSASGGLLRNALIYHSEENTWSHRFLGSAYGFTELRASIDFGGATWDEQGTLVWEDANAVWDATVYEPTFAELIVLDRDANGDYRASVLTDEETVGFSTSVFAPISRAARWGLPIEGAVGVPMITEVWAELEGNISQIRIRFGGQTQPSGPITWSSWFPVVPGSRQHFDPRISGRYLAWELESTDYGSWRLGAITLRYTPGGER